MVTEQLALPLEHGPDPRRDSDMLVWWRARCAGWEPKPEHCPPGTVNPERTQMAVVWDPGEFADRLALLERVIDCHTTGRPIPDELRAPVAGW